MLLKEHEENDVQSHAASAPMVGSGWQRQDGQAAIEHASWSQHVAPRAVSWNKGIGEHEDRSTSGGHFVPVLDQEDFPSLEDATHSKGHPSAPKAKTANRSTAVGLDDKEEVGLSIKMLNELNGSHYCRTGQTGFEIQLPLSHVACTPAGMDTRLKGQR